MPRPFTDITTAKGNQPIKNKSSVFSSMPGGKYQTYNKYVENVPNINTIYNIYGNRFYNGIFVIVQNS